LVLIRSKKVVKRVMKEFNKYSKQLKDNTKVILFGRTAIKLAA